MIPSLVLHNTWHYMIIRYSYGELPKFVLRCSYEAALCKGVTTALEVFMVLNVKLNSKSCKHDEAIHMNYNYKSNNDELNYNMPFKVKSSM